MSRTRHDILVDTAKASQDAPWPGTRRWRWTVRDDALDLYGEPGRDEQIRDPAARPLLLAEGAALHRARICLTAAGWLVRVRRLPREYDDVIARVSYLGQCSPRARDRLLHRMLVNGRDRLARAAVPAVDLIPSIEVAIVNEGVRLHPVPPGQCGWLGRDGRDGAAPGYLIVHGDTDLAYDWLRGGEATSAAMLAAAAGGLRLRLVDAPGAAATLRAIVPGQGYVYAVLSHDDQDAIVRTSRPPPCGLPHPPGPLTTLPERHTSGQGQWSRDRGTAISPGARDLRH